MPVAISPLPDAQASGVLLLNAAKREDTRNIVRSTPFNPSALPSPAEAFSAALWRENTVLSLWHELTDGDGSPPVRYSGPASQPICRQPITNQALGPRPLATPNPGSLGD
jgi:hypothetical protein